MLSQTVEYALRAVVHLASMSPTARTTEQIAQATLVPRAYLSKVLQSLARGGVVQSQRGLGGGVSLVKSPDQLTILEVVNAVEPIQRIRTCPLGLPNHGTHLCPLHKRVDNALAMMEQAFASTTLAEVLAEPSRSIPLCRFPNEQVIDDSVAEKHSQPKAKSKAKA
ncbi:HTH-type transcriptional repressor NsrR [Anatilimnocola aggregata]|uniref:HTH-type transcriptional repressor NsrR n=1 Tax=Anatilimnocola aggregata TaxID=2528021 RepID=A0A517YDG2_9BACT|nr:Rrf2 family transcriptional regulator [Anatilimnocola aggregata]QDU28172.1 HTH-type transcriptional repressor NsrR [Anatilimnocola aggregata]